jgi:hypothetical protein
MFHQCVGCGFPHLCKHECLRNYDPEGYNRMHPEPTVCHSPPLADLAPLDEREAVLTEALSLTKGNRNVSYGEPEDNFTRIALHLSVFLKNRHAIDIALGPEDVALMMALMKIARLEFNITHRDSYVDLAGYSACGAAIAKNMKAAYRARNPQEKEAKDCE